MLTKAQLRALAESATHVPVRVIKAGERALTDKEINERTRDVTRRETGEPGVRYVLDHRGLHAKNAEGEWLY